MIMFIGVKISLVELELEDEEEEGDRLRKWEMNGSGNKDFHQRYVKMMMIMIADHDD